jgi:RHS repeat-associated protein
MAAMCLEDEKPHRGVPTRKSAPYQGQSVCKSTTALGLQSTAVVNRIGSCSTGKERDAESGLDFLVSRYYSSNMGRFMSPDWSSNPISIPFARIDNPQTLNLYGYVGNNPLRYFDSYGHSKDCGGGGDPSVVCIVTSAWDKIKSWFGGGGGSGSGGGNSPAPAPAPDPGSGNVFLVTSTIRSVNRAPDYYSFSAQAGFANPTLSYVPKTNNFFFNFQAGAPKGIGVMGTAGWSLSRRPEDYPGSNAENYLGGRGVGGCGAFVVASCVGYSPGGGGWAFEAGLGTPGWSGTAGYAFDWNSVVGGMWNAMPVEDPMAAMPSNGAVGIGSGLVYNPCMDGMDCR